MTQAELLSVLGSLETIRIRGEYRSGYDYGGLDSVVLTAPPIDVNNSTIIITPSQATADGLDFGSTG